MEIRRARPEDRDALYDICLRTGDAGADATARYDDHDLLGHVYVGPYLARQPELAFVAANTANTANTGGVVGYAVGALDASSFAAELERSWWPALRERYPLGARRRDADQRIVRLIHDPPAAPGLADPGYPSELHVDLLPRAQGHGAGRRLVDTLLDALAAAGSPGVQLRVDPRNEPAIGFYRHVGFRLAAAGSAGIDFVRPLAPPG